MWTETLRTGTESIVENFQWASSESPTGVVRESGIQASITENEIVWLDLTNKKEEKKDPEYVQRELF